MSDMADGYAYAALKPTANWPGTWDDEDYDSWLKIPIARYIDPLYALVKQAGETQDTKDDALQVAWQEMLDDTPQRAMNAEGGSFLDANYNRYTEAGGNYTIGFMLMRYFYRVTIPENCVEAKWWSRNFYRNYYETGRNSYRKNPLGWVQSIHGSKTIPKFGSDLPDDWNFGQEMDAMWMPNVFSRDSSGEPQDSLFELTGWEAGEMFYMQERMSMTRPDHLLTTEWPYLTAPERPYRLWERAYSATGDIWLVYKLEE